MGNTTPNQRAPYVEHLSLAVILPRYILIGNLTLIGVFGMMIMGIVGLMHYASPTSNPFAAYTDVFPGQPIGALDELGFDCAVWDYNYYHDATETRCNLSPDAGTFNHIEAIYSSDVIRRVNFEIRDAAYRVDDLVGWLDILEFHQRGGIMFSWRGNVGVARLVHPYKKFSLLRHVWQIALTDIRYESP